MLCLVSKTRPDILFASQKFSKFTHNTKALHETSVNNICCYIQVTNYKGLLFDPSKILVLYCYVDAYFEVLWGHDNPQGPIFYNIRACFVVMVSNYNIFWVSNMQT